MDAPPGRFDRVPSRITGQILCFFTPEPLSELLRRCEPRVDGPTASPNGETWGALPLLRMATRRSGRTDKVGAAAMASAVFRGATQGNGHAAAAANPRPDLVFSGGRVASQAHVFADPASIASQLADLKETLSRDDVCVPTPAFIACVAFHAMHLHPFQDGNGRWARQLVVEVATDRGASLSGVAHAALLNEGKPQLVSRHWPEARERGLRDYIERSSNFDFDMRGAAASSAMVVSSIFAHLGQIVRPAWLGRDLLVQLCLGEPLSIGQLRATGNVSRHVAAGWFKALSHLELPGVAVRDDVVSLAPLIEAAERSARLAVSKHFGAPHT